MGGIGFLGDKVTLYIRVPGGGYAVRLLSGVLFSASEGISGGDATPMRKAVMYYFDSSHCTDPDGNKCSCISPPEWSERETRKGVFTFDSSGGSWLCEGDLTAHPEPPFDNAYRITAVERHSGGRRLLRHFKVSCE